MQKTFSLQEAQKALIFVKPVTEDLQRLFFEIAALHSAVPQDLIEQVDRRIQIMKHHFNELKLVGCICFDPEHGEIDFPSFLDARPILLSWKLGEESIQFWKELKNPRQRLAIDGRFQTQTALALSTEGV